MFFFFFDIVDYINKKAICVSVRFYCQEPLGSASPLWLGTVTFQNCVVCTSQTSF
jgi:hypothetical protein